MEFKGLIASKFEDFFTLKVKFTPKVK